MKLSFLRFKKFRSHNNFIQINICVRFDSQKQSQAQELIF